MPLSFKQIVTRVRMFGETREASVAAFTPDGYKWESCQQKDPKPSVILTADLIVWCTTHTETQTVWEEPKPLQFLLFSQIPTPGLNVLNYISISF